jgi:hypothetical protein
MNSKFSRPQDCDRIDRLFRSGGAFSIAKRSFAAENMPAFYSKKWQRHFFDTRARSQGPPESQISIKAR